MEPLWQVVDYAYDKHSSLPIKSVNYNQISFVTFAKKKVDLAKVIFLSRESLSAKVHLHTRFPCVSVLRFIVCWLTVLL